jgi:hypothetical protein
LAAARSLLVSELACANDCTADEVGKKLEKLFLRRPPTALD